MLNHNMDFWNLAVRIIFLAQTTTGILGNLSLVFYYLLLYYRECTLKPSELILMHLMAANVLLILSSGVPQTMAVWGLKQFLSDFGCKILLYIQGFSRSVSIGTTCLLSVFQAITISLKKSCWKDHKVKAEKYIGCYISFIWAMHMSINFIFFVYTFIKGNSKNMTRKRDFGYCSTIGSNDISDSLYAVLVVWPEIFFSVLIAWSSMSMIIFLYRHKQKVQHIRSTHDSSRSSPDSRATQIIMALMSTFLTFYTLSSILRGCIAFLYNHNWWLVNISPLTSLCFPSFVPFVLMSHYSVMLKHSLVWIRNKTCQSYFTCL
ncbi:vomeronasal type-1 receptor 4-like [Meriones unguiculatus]|uniref:vomeronasal type-1 receptor 4-like n=1 Tax=Meriones unguiculatus TaxID=10047 RepID=UPI000B4F2053|nr:vomeronasal type-1 receptor 4-like [Meriones unguiculatus]